MAVKYLEIGELYRWCPIGKYSEGIDSYVLYLSLEMNISESFSREEELVVPLEVVCEKKYPNTKYRVLLSSGRMGWINIHDECINHWIKVTKPL